jgi:hypothetical protein
LEDQRLGVVAGLGFSRQTLDDVIGDRTSGFRVSVDRWFGHGSRSLAYLSRIGIAWITICAPSAVISTTTSSRLPAVPGR